MLEVYGNINIVGDDVDFYENGKRRTAGVGIHSRGTVVAGLGATIIDFVGTAVSSILFSDVGIATVNLRKTSFTETPHHIQQLQDKHHIHSHILLDLLMFM